MKKIKLRDLSWVSFFEVAWELLALATEKSGRPLDCRTIEGMYGPAVAESLIRYQGASVAKLIPSVGDIWQAYKAAGGEGEDARLSNYLFMADNAADEFAAISGDKYVAVGPKMGARAQVICILSHKLPPVQSQTFQTYFVWPESRRKLVFNDDELAVWNALELELGMGVIASIWDAKQRLPDLTPEEYATSFLRKYGVPVVIDGIEVFSCHYCAPRTCSCGGGKAAKRKVTYADAAQNLHRGPMDTQLGMLYPYAEANNGRGGVGYGPLRAKIEASAEKGAIIPDVEGDSTLPDLKRRFGPLFLPQQRHWAEVISRIGRPAEDRRKASVSEFADAGQWQDLYGPKLLDHANGLIMAHKTVAADLDVEIEFPLEDLTKKIPFVVYDGEWIPTEQARQKYDDYWNDMPTGSERPPRP